MAIKQIIKHLHELHVLHLELIRLGEQKKEAIIANQVDELSKLVQSETKLAKTIGMIEGQRTEAIISFQKENGIAENENATINEIAELTNDPAMKKQLLDVGSKLTETVEQLKDLNELNNNLIQRSLDFIQLNIELMTGSEQEMIYHNPGQKPKTQGYKGIFDSRV